MKEFVSRSRFVERLVARLRCIEIEVARLLLLSRSIMARRTQARVETRLASFEVGENNNKQYNDFL